MMEVNVSGPWQNKRQTFLQKENYRNEYGTTLPKRHGNTKNTLIQLLLSKVAVLPPPLKNDLGHGFWAGAQERTTNAGKTVV